MDLAVLIVIGNALILGVRHGIDWDHVAAIADIVGTVGTTKLNEDTVSISQSDEALRLSWCYALGHATIVLILGMAALAFAAVLPGWIDPLMEKAVGITLLALGLWIFYSLKQQAANSQNFVLQSRWMFILSKMQQASEWVHSRLTGKPIPSAIAFRQYNAPAAFGVGVIHGFGAETGTQVLLIAAVGGSSTHLLGVIILVSFITGLLISNTLLALLTCAGFVSSAKFKPLLLAISIITGLFSVTVGMIFVGGFSNLLPSLRHN